MCHVPLLVLYAVAFVVEPLPVLCALACIHALAWVMKMLINCVACPLLMARVTCSCSPVLVPHALAVPYAFVLVMRHCSGKTRHALHVPSSHELESVNIIIIIIIIIMRHCCHLQAFCPRLHKTKACLLAFGHHQPSCVSCNAAHVATRRWTVQH